MSTFKFSDKIYNSKTTKKIVSSNDYLHRFDIFLKRNIFKKLQLIKMKIKFFKNKFSIFNKESQKIRKAFNSNVSIVT